MIKSYLSAIIFISLGYTLKADATQELTFGDRVSEETVPYYMSMEDALEVAIQDFGEILEQSPEIGLGLDLSTLERSVPGRGIQRFEIELDSLLRAGAMEDFDELEYRQLSTIVPLETEGYFTTIIELSEEDEGWRILALAGSVITDELNEILLSIPDGSPSDITLFEVPELQVSIFNVIARDERLFFSNYQDSQKNSFTLTAPISSDTIINFLITDAQNYEQKYREMQDDVNGDLTH